jgi:hypothetical protein
LHQELDKLISNNQQLLKAEWDSIKQEAERERRALADGLTLWQSMRWERGLFRFWVVLSLAWIAWVVPENWNQLTGWWVLHQTGEHIGEPNFQAAWKIFSLPIVALYIGLALVWVIRGFRKGTA